MKIRCPELVQTIFDFVAFIVALVVLSGMIFGLLLAFLWVFAAFF